MGGEKTGFIAQLIERSESSILDAWVRRLIETGALRSGQISENKLRDQCGRFLSELRAALQAGEAVDLREPAWTGMRELLGEISRERAITGFTPSETATFVLSLKKPLFDVLKREFGKDAQRLADEIWSATEVLDMLALYTTEVFLSSREGIIKRQQDELVELSTPVVRLWDGIVALPLIGTLDSERTQTVMENLLESIVSEGAEIAIIDITGVQTVDTLVAQHLMKTISAARLMGADCIISGIRPQIAQTIVHLGLDLGVISKATMADAFALGLRRLGKTVRSMTEKPAKD